MYSLCFCDSLALAMIPACSMTIMTDNSVMQILLWLSSISSLKQHRIYVGLKSCTDSKAAPDQHIQLLQQQKTNKMTQCTELVDIQLRVHLAILMIKKDFLWWFKTFFLSHFSSLNDGILRDHKTCHPSYILQERFLYLCFSGWCLVMYLNLMTVDVLLGHCQSIWPNQTHTALMT